VIDLLDVTVLVALAWPNHVHHHSARRWFAHRPGPWATTPVTECGFVRVSSDRVVIPDAVTPVDLRPLSVGTPVAVGFEPDAVAFAPSGAVALIADLGDDQVTVLDGSTAAVTRTLSVPVPPTDVAVTRHPAPGATVATDPAGTAWVSGGGDLVPIDLATMTVGQPIAVGRPAEAVALTDGGRTAWVASTVGTLTKVDLVTGRVEGTTHVGGHPTAVVVPVSAPPPAGTAR
jgi:YVTN family beta-propeller protein